MRISDWSSDVCSSDLCDKFLSLRISEEDYERLRKAARKAKVRSISAYVRELIRAAVGGTSILDVILDAELREINGRMSWEMSELAGALDRYVSASVHVDAKAAAIHADHLPREICNEIARAHV